MFTRECLLSAQYSITGFVCEKEGVCTCRVSHSVCVPRSHRMCSLPSLSLFQHLCEVIQSQSKRVQSSVYRSCDAAQINTLVLFMKQTYSYTTLPSLFPCLNPILTWVIFHCSLSEVSCSTVMMSTVPSWLPLWGVDQEDSQHHNPELLEIRHNPI